MVARSYHLYIELIASCNSELLSLLMQQVSLLPSSTKCSGQSYPTLDCLIGYNSGAWKAEMVAESESGDGRSTRVTYVTGAHFQSYGDGPDMRCACWYPSTYLGCAIGRVGS